MTTTLGSSSESPPYVEAKYQEKNSNQAKVYINSCPNTETADAETENNFSFSENSLKIPKVNAQTNTSDNANCKSCGQNSTCHFVYGNENAKYKFILIRGKGGCSGTDNPCEQKSNWGQNDQKSFESFKKAVETMAKDIDYAPDGAKSFAVYRSDLVADKDPSCPPLKKFDSYGYICQGSGGSAYARFRGNAAYCLDWIKPGYPVLAHEQIGHAFAQLDDEYENCNMNPNRHPSPHYNCTDPKNLARSGLGAKTKWGNLVSGIYSGCLYSSKFSRSSFNSIMRGSRAAWFYNSFDSVNNETIKETINSFPNGPSFGGEQLMIQCTVK